MDDMLEMKQRERLSMRECKGDYIKWNELSNQNLVDSLMMLGEEERNLSTSMYLKNEPLRISLYQVV